MTTDDFDWVTAQAACTAATMFPRLLAGVRRDVQRRNELAHDDDFRFDVHEDGERFEVTRAIGSRFDTAKVDAAVTFERVGPRITVQGDGVEVDFSTIVGITPAGVCRFFVGEAEYAEWEVRKLALDQLFFEEVEE